MNIEELLAKVTPGHAKRAGRFMGEAIVQVHATPGVGTWDVYDLFEVKGASLVQARTTYIKPKKIRQLSRRIHQADIESLKYSAVGVEATSDHSQILIDLLNYLDMLARNRNAVEPEFGPRIFEFDEPGELAWILSAAWYFVDKK